MNNLPEFLSEKINLQYGNEVDTIYDGLAKKRVTSFRINQLKTDNENTQKLLQCNNIDFVSVPWFNDAYILNSAKNDFFEYEQIKCGEIYLQSLSSMLPPLFMNLKDKSDILDMAAAPGGKTAQIASLSNCGVSITACERNPIRAEKLKHNLELQGVKNTTVIVKDARQLDDFFSFDEILLDAPCSGSGTLNINRDCSYLTEKLLNKTTATQTALLKKAMKLVKKGGRIVYSTCSILKEENEEILNKCLNGNFKIIPISPFKDLPTLKSTIDGVITVCPTEFFEGFFIAVIERIK